jgi:hypothetical protein
VWASAGNLRFIAAMLAQQSEGGDRWPKNPSVLRNPNVLQNLNIP